MTHPTIQEIRIARQTLNEQPIPRDAIVCTSGRQEGKVESLRRELAAYVGVDCQIVHVHTSAPSLCLSCLKPLHWIITERERKCRCGAITICDGTAHDHAVCYRASLVLRGASR